MVGRPAVAALRTRPKARPSSGNRLFLHGLLHMVHVRRPWRETHGRYGKWRSVYIRFRHFGVLLIALVDLGLTGTGST